MADEEVVAGLKQVKDEITRQREDDSKQTGQLAESINKLRAESNQKSDGIVGTLTTSFKDNAAEVTAGFILQRKDHAFIQEKRMDKVDDEVEELHTTVKGGNTERKSLLQRIAAWVDPNMQGSQDRERDVENKLNFKKQTDFFARMAKSLDGMVVRPIRTTAAGIWTFLKGLAFGGALLALLNFLDGDTWKDWQEWVVERLPKKVEQLKNIFKAIMDGDFMKAFEEIGEMLGLWSKDLDPSKTSAWDFFKQNITAFLLAIGALALVFAPKLALMSALKLAYLAGTGWLFVAPVVALFKALGKLPGAAKTALGNIGKAAKALAPPAKGTVGFSSGGQRYQATPVPAQGPQTQAQLTTGQRPTYVKVTPVGRPGSGGGGGAVTPAVQAAGEARINPQNAWQALAAKFGAAGPMFRYATKFLRGAGATLLGWNLYKIWLDNTGGFPNEGDAPLNTTQQLNETIVQLGAFNAATLVGSLVSGGVIAAGVGPWGALAAALAVGGAAFFGAETGLRPLVEELFGTGSDKKRARDWVSKGLDAEEAAKVGVGTDTSVLDGASKAVPNVPDAIKSRMGGGRFRSSSAVPTPAESAFKLAQATSPVIRTPSPAAAVTKTAVTPTSGAAVAAAGTGLNAASRAATNATTGDMTPPIVSTNNQQINHNSHIQVAAKEMTHPSPIVREVMLT